MSNAQEGYTEIKTYETIRKEFRMLLYSLLMLISPLLLNSYLLMNISDLSELGIVKKVLYSIFAMISIIVMIQGIIKIIHIFKNIIQTNIKETLSLAYEDVCYFNDVLEFPSEPGKLYRRYYFMHEEGTGDGEVCFKYPEKPCQEISYDNPKTVMGEELLNLCQVEEVDFYDIRNLYDGIVEGNMAINRHEDNITRERIREIYQNQKLPNYNNSETSKSLHRLSERLMDIDKQNQERIQKSVENNDEIIKKQSHN